MKKYLSVFLLLISMGANATYYQLVSCDYEYVIEYKKYVYIGTYKSQFGNFFTKTFTSYCPASIND